MELVAQHGNNSPYVVLDWPGGEGGSPSREDVHLATHGANGTSLGSPDADKEPDYFHDILFGIVTPVIFGIITFVGLLGNLLVMHVIRARKKMRTVTNLLLLNLAVADLSFVIICPPFTAYQFATSEWPFHGILGNIICKLMHYLLNVTVYVTIYTLVLISVIRYLTVVHNARTMAIRTKQNTVIMIIMIWCIILCVNIPIPLVYRVDVEHGQTVCDNFGIEMGQKIYATFFVFAYLLPLCIIAIFSMCILRHIRKNEPKMLSKKTKTSQKKKQATQLIILVIVIFAIFWLPVHIHLLIAYYSKLPDNRFYHCLTVLWFSLAYCNSCVNPIIYNYTSKDFRDSFRDTVCCVKWSPDWDRDGASFVTKIGHTHAPPKNAATGKTLVVEANGDGGGNQIDSEESPRAEEV